MNIVIALDSFKGSLTSIEAGEAVRRGILTVFPRAEIKVMPLADGGEGTVEALTLGMGGVLQPIEVTGPLGEKVLTSYGILPALKTGIIEMAAAAGITLVPEDKRNPLYTTTYGVGEMLLDAIHKGCRHFIIGIGGSATNDGGLGMLQALGFAMQDKNGQPVPRGAVGLRDISRIEYSGVVPELKDCTFRIACDVTNPLLGENGCSAVFAPQKGAGAEDIRKMDKWLAHYVDVIRTGKPEVNPQAPGAGAAGGLGFAFMTFMNAQLESGIDIVLAETKLEEHIAQADFVITGEGRLDGQTVMGKAPIGVAKIAKKYHKPVIAFAGGVTPEAKACNQHGIDAYFPIVRQAISLAEAMQKDNAERNLLDTVEQAMRLLYITKNI